MTAGGLLIFSPALSTTPPTATTGDLKGTVLDGDTQQPLSGVAVTVVSNQGISSTTSSAGAFTLSNIPQGSQQISLALAGYAPATVTVNVVAGSVINMGNISLFVSPTTGIIQGVITDAQTGSPLSDALVTVTGATTLTANTAVDGSYKISNILPQTVTISVEKAGYFTVSTSAAVTAGGLLIFSPALSTTPPTATTGDLKGTVLDGVTNQPITGATIAATLNGTTAATTTDAVGAFSILSLVPGNYTVVIAASGYTGQTYKASVVSDSTILTLPTSLTSIPLPWGEGRVRGVL